MRKEEEIKGTAYEYVDDIMEGFSYIYQLGAYAIVKGTDNVRATVYPVKEGLLDVTGISRRGTQGNYHGSAYQTNTVINSQTFAMDY